MGEGGPGEGGKGKKSTKNVSRIFWMAPKSFKNLAKTSGSIFFIAMVCDN